MLQTTYLRDNREEALQRLAKRGFDATAIVDEIIALDDKRKSTQTTWDSILAESNKLAKEIGDLFKQGKSAEANVAKQRTVELKGQSSELQDVMQATEAALLDKLYQLPNTPHSSVPKGKTAEDNETVSEHGQMPKLPENALPHWELAKKYGIIDFEMGVKVTGAGFPVYAGQGARLQRALINFFLDEAHKAGYKEYIPPFMVNQASGYGTGQLPDKEGQMYYMPADDFYMVPTAEVPLTNFFRDVIVKAEELPVKLTAYTPCFRREAGSYGKDVKGLNRLHQFDKVEIVQVAHPDKSYAILEDMVKHVTDLLDKLELPYRILRLCGGDMGFTSALTYDLEVYSAAQGRWLEVSSISNFETFQANRLKLRFREGTEKPQLAHTLNGSALALPRILASLLENNQTEDSIRIPKVLHAYTGFAEIRNA